MIGIISIFSFNGAFNHVALCLFSKIHGEVSACSGGYARVIFVDNSDGVVDAYSFMRQEHRGLSRSSCVRRVVSAVRHADREVLDAF